MNMTYDNFWQEFQGGENELAALKATQKELEDASTWLTARDLECEALDTPMDVEIRATDPLNRIPKDIMDDTTDNSKLILHYDGQQECLRSCAMPSLFGTAGISGPGISRSAKPDLADGLSIFLRACRDKSQLLYRAGKISAVLSDRYCPIPILETLESCNALEHTFGKARFLGGSIGHDLTTARFAFPDAEATFTAAYQQAGAAFGIPSPQSIIPVVEFRASDTSNEATRLMSYLQFDHSRVLFPIGEGVKVIHVQPREYNENGVRMTCQEKFEEEIETLFGKIQDDISTVIPAMASTVIHYPANCVVGLAKYAGIPQKWGGHAEKRARQEFEGRDCNFLSVFSLLTDCTGYAMDDDYTAESRRMLALQEGLGKISQNRACWRRFDVPGTVAWSTAAAANK